MTCPLAVDPHPACVGEPGTGGNRRHTASSTPWAVHARCAERGWSAGREARAHVARGAGEPHLSVPNGEEEDRFLFVMIGRR